MKKSILILSHQGFSFLEDLVFWCKSNSITPLILSSEIQRDSEKRHQEIQVLTEKTMFTLKPSLSIEDLTDAISFFSERNLKPSAVISVWEGYRELMSLGNLLVGGTDLSVGTVAKVLNKATFRKTLYDHQLSKVESVTANQKNIKTWLDRKKPGFIKPVRGLGSFGAFKLNDHAIKNIASIKQQMKTDIEYHGIFSKKQEFLIEDYIPGIEFSFEIVAVDSKLYFLGTHEKLDVEETVSTTLENFCISPPVSVSKSVQEDAKMLIEKAFHLFDLKNGLFHVEAKWDPFSDRWELIEINPRVGGALIKESVGLRNSNLSLLGLWIGTILSSDRNSREQLKKKLSVLELTSKRSKKCTLFRVFFGHPGRILKTIQASKKMKPSLIKIHYKVGQTLPSVDREVFLGQALWVLPKVPNKVGAKAFIEKSKQALEIEYV